MTDANRYPAQVFWSDEDEGYIALATDLPGCSAFGETQQEALTELQSAIVAWIEAARAAGNPIPAPSQPAAENHCSGKILVRMPKSLHTQLARSAKAEDASLNQYIVVLLTWANTHRVFEPMLSPPEVHHGLHKVTLKEGPLFHKVEGRMVTSQQDFNVFNYIEESLSSRVEAGTLRYLKADHLYGLKKISTSTPKNLVIQIEGASKR